MEVLPNDPHDNPLEPMSYHELDAQKKEVFFLAELIVSGLELADSIEISDLDVVAKQATITIDPTLIDKLPSGLLPEGLERMITKDNLGIVVEFSWQYSGERPSLKFLLHDEERGNTPVLVLERTSADTVKEDDFGGSFISSDGLERPVRLNSDDLGLLIEELIGNEDIIVSNEEILAARLITDMVGDPQHPPMARYIQDVLIQKGCEYVMKNRYNLEIEGKTFPIEIITENGKTTSIEISDIFASDLLADGDSFIQHERGIAAQISAHDLTVSVQFFRLENGTMHPYMGDSGDQLRLHERIAYLKDYLQPPETNEHFKEDL